jgi:hypothetical protein
VPEGGAAFKRELLWRRLDEPGAEHLLLRVDRDGVAADGLVVGIEGGAPFRAHYRVWCDAAWRAREVWVAAPGSERPALHLRADGDGRWTTGDGRPLPELAGCIDLDLTATPFTNTLPIRRLALAIGESAPVRSAWIRFPGLRLEPLEQTYTRKSERSFRYRALVDGEPFTARLDTDAFGRVLRYEGLWEAELAEPGDGPAGNEVT